MTEYKIVLEKHADGYIAYPLGLQGIVIGQGDTAEQALADVKSAIKFHRESFPTQRGEGDPPLLEVTITEVAV